MEIAKSISLSLFKPLRYQFDDDELIRQYKIQFGENCKYFPTADSTVWSCACGAFNNEEEALCHICQCSFYEMTSSVTLQKLIKDMKERIEKEDQEAEIEREIRKKQINKVIIRGIISLIAVVFITMVTILISEYVEKVKIFNYAVSFLETGEYTEAIQYFKDIVPFKNSEELLLESKYQEACASINQLADLSMTLSLQEAERKCQILSKKFSEIIDYKDSNKKITNIDDILRGYKIVNHDIYGELQSRYKTVKFDLDRNMVTIDKIENWILNNDDISKSKIYSNNYLAYKYYDSFKNANILSELYRKKFIDAELDEINVSVNVYTPHDELIYTSLNGVQEAGEIGIYELAEHINKIQKKAYDIFTETILRGAYFEAEDLYEKDYKEYLPLDYKDVKYYFEYMLLMNRYSDRDHKPLHGCIDPNDMKSVIKSMPTDFLNTKAWLQVLENIENCIDALYINESSNASNCRINRGTLFLKNGVEKYNLLYNIEGNELINIQAYTTSNDVKYTITPIQKEGNIVTVIEITDNVEKAIYHRAVGDNE